MKNLSSQDSCEEKSFFEKLKTDKKYSAKVQLIGYGIVILILVVYLNLVNMGNVSTSNNSILNGTGSSNQVDENKNASLESSNLLKKIDDNYRYDVRVKLGKKNGEEEEESQVHYLGKSYGNQLEITKEDSNGSNLYYKVDDRYYVLNEENLDFIGEEVIYDLLKGEFIELDGIQKLLNKAVLDHVTDYSSGKKEYVYHLKVKDIIVSYQKEDEVLLYIVQENNALTIKIDYTNLLHVMDGAIDSCEVESTYTEIGKIEEFSVLKQEENTSVE